jgi:hypothetical protein
MYCVCYCILCLLWKVYPKAWEFFLKKNSSFGIQRIINLLCNFFLFSIHHHVNSCSVFECSPYNCQLAIVIHQSSPSPLFIFTMWPLDFHLGSLSFDMFTITKSESIHKPKSSKGLKSELNHHIIISFHFDEFLLTI